MLNKNLSAYGLVIMRVMFGLGIAWHGYGKVFGGNMGRLIEGVTNMGFPMPELFAWMAALSELVGGIFLALGLFTQLSALMIFGTMTVAAFIVHGADPFSKKELALAYWSVAAGFMLVGGGKFSLDNFIFNKK